MRVFIHIFAVLAWLSGIAQHSHGSEFVHIPGGEFRSVIPQAEGDNLIEVAEFLVQEAPVTNGEFLQFVLHHEDWRRGNAVALFADGQYLSTWSGPISLPPEPGQQQPVTQVSWFAANAYCEGKTGRLPSWDEWEYIAAANETMADARVLPEWRQTILSWY